MTSNSKPSTSMGRRLRSTTDVLAEIFPDSDSGGDSDDDFDVGNAADSATDSDVNASSDEAESGSVSDEPPLPKKRKHQEPSFVWKDTPFVPQRFVFTGCPGIKPDLLSTLPDEPTPLDYFSFFVHDELIDILPAGSFSTCL